MRPPDGYNSPDYYADVAREARAIKAAREDPEAAAPPPSFSERAVRNFAAAIGVRSMDEAKLAGGDLVFDGRYVGYLVRTLDARDIGIPYGVSVFVPFHLAFVFPNDRFLNEAVRIGTAIRLLDGHTICLSGSATFFGKIEQSADLDFCEYFTSPGVCAAPAVAAREPLGDPLLVSFKSLKGEPILAGTDDFADRVHEAMVCGKTEIPTAFKLDFVGVSDRFGPVPITSVVLPLDPLTRSGGHAERSFPFQEAVIGGSPLRKLSDPMDFGTYVCWLRDQIDDLLDKQDDSLAAIKALKRGLSAVLALGVQLVGDPFRGADCALAIERLNDPVVSVIVKDARIKELRRFADVSSREDLGEILKDITDYKEPPDIIRQTALEGARLTAEAVKDVIDEIFNKGESTAP